MISLRTGIHRAKGPAISLRGTPALFLALLLVAALAACSSGSPGGGGERGAPQPDTTETRDTAPEATEQVQPEPTRRDILGRAGSRSTTNPAPPRNPKPPRNPGAGP